MEDREIVQLYWDRDEAAIKESSLKYGAYCRSISRNILGSWEDAEEVVNDTWLKAWNAIPPKKPSILSVFLGRITRNLSFDIYRREHREKRGGHQIDLVLDELAECLSATETPESTFDAQELARAINAFLQTLESDDRALFMRRYFFGDSVSDAAKQLSLSRTVASVRLYRLRQRMRDRLLKGGFLP